jgi:hypothetical protein
VTPNRPPAETPERASNMPPGRSPGESSDRAPSESSEHAPGKTPERSPNMTPSGAPGETSDSAPSESPQHAPSKTPERAPNMPPSGAPAETSDPELGESPQHAPGMRPERAPGATPGRPTGTAGRASNMTPGESYGRPHDETPERAVGEAAERSPDVTLIGPYDETPGWVGEDEPATDPRGEEETGLPADRRGLRRVLVAVLLLAVVGVSAGMAFALVRPGQGAPASFQDDFQSGRGWPERQDAGGAARYYGGGYLLQLPPGRGMVAAAPVRSDQIGSVRVSARVRIQAGTAEFGVWCGGNPVRQAANRYDFYLTSAGAAGIAKQSAASGRKDLRAAEPVSDVDTQGGQNLLEAECRFASGVARLRLSLNGRVVANAEDRDRFYGPGSCGVEALSDSGGLESAAVRYESFGARAIS